MQQNNNLSVLPFYTSIDEQHHRKPYAYGAVYPLYAHNTSLPPFQVVRTTRNANTLSVIVYDKNGTLVADITQLMIAAGLQIVRREQLGYDVIVFPASLHNLTGIGIGQYYVTLSDGVETWYSDIVTFVSDTTGYLYVEWYCRDNVEYNGGEIIYKNPSFRNQLLLCTQLGKPEYPFEEEGESRDGYFFPEKQISEKVYKFQFMASEYLCDVMRLIRMADVVIVRDRYGRVYRCDQFLMTPEWQEQGDLASVTVEFHTDTVIKKIGTGYQVELNGDFDDDYNNDYNI